MIGVNQLFGHIAAILLADILTGIAAFNVIIFGTLMIAGFTLPGVAWLVLIGAVGIGLVLWLYRASLPLIAGLWNTR